MRDGLGTRLRPEAVFSWRTSRRAMRSTRATHHQDEPREVVGVILEPILDHDEAVALGRPRAGDRGDGGITADADETSGASGIVRLDGLDLRMLGEEAAALLEGHL